MKTERNPFDCAEMMDRAALRIYEETKNMTVEEELAYWRMRQEDALKALDQTSETLPAEH